MLDKCLKYFVRASINNARIGKGNRKDNELRIELTRRVINCS